MTQAYEVQQQSLINIAIEGWRLSKINPEADKDRIRLKNFVREFEQFLECNKVEVVDLTGHNYEPGMALEVIFTEGKSITEPEKEIIIEMVRPLILLDGSVVKHGQVVTKKMIRGKA